MGYYVILRLSHRQRWKVYSATNLILMHMMVIHRMHRNRRIITRDTYRIIASIWCIIHQHYNMILLGKRRNREWFDLYYIVLNSHVDDQWNRLTYSKSIVTNHTPRSIFNRYLIDNILFFKHNPLNRDFIKQRYETIVSMYSDYSREYISDFNFHEYKIENNYNETKIYIKYCYVQVKNNSFCPLYLL